MPQSGPPSADPSRGFPLSADPGTTSPDTGPPRPSANDDAPGVGESIGRVRAGVNRLVTAHLGLLKAELAVTGREMGIIVAMVLAAISIIVVALLLIAIGSFLFLGEWLFGSMGWGILHGTLFLALLVVPIAIDLAGGWAAATVRGLAAGFGVTVVLWALFASNVLRDTAVHAGESLESSVRLEPALLPTLVALAAGAIVVGGVLAIAGSRMRMGVRLGIAGALVGGIVGAILGSVTFDTKGALAIALTVGLIVAIVVSAVVAQRRGFDAERRYERLVPRESLAMAEETKRYLERQWRRQRRKVVGR